MIEFPGKGRRVDGAVCATEIWNRGLDGTMHLMDRHDVDILNNSNNAIGQQLLNIIF